MLWSASTGSLQSARNLTFGGKKQKQTARDQAETWIWLTVKLQRLHWHRCIRTLSAHMHTSRQAESHLSADWRLSPWTWLPTSDQELTHCHTAVTHTQTPVPQTSHTLLVSFTCDLWQLLISLLHSAKLQIPEFRTRLGKFSFSYRETYAQHLVWWVSPGLILVNCKEKQEQKQEI